MSIPLSCPSCNTGFALDTLPPTRRATCPRCGDVFLVRGDSADTDTGEQTFEDRSRPSAAISDAVSEVRTPDRGHAPRRMVLVAVVLGILGCAVGLAAYYAREPKPYPEPPAPEFTVTPPKQLIGLGYLPAECNVVFAVQPGPLLEYAARTNQEPRELLAAAGVPDQAFGALDSLGLALAQIDHIAGGAYLTDPGDGELRVALVLVLKQPLPDEGAFRTQLQLRSAGGKDKHDSVKVRELPLLMVRVSPTVWAFGYGEGDFSAVEKGGFGPGGAQFRGSETDGLWKMLAAVPPEAAVWVAADDERDWTQKPLVKLFTTSDEAKKWVPRLSGGRGAVFALSFGERPRMRLGVRTAETADAEHLRAYFAARAAEVESATAGGDGTFAQLDAPYDPKLLRRFVADLR